MRHRLPRLTRAAFGDRRAYSALLAYALPLFVAAAVLLGSAIRATHVLSSDFPLNDGGLFFVMTEDLRAADYRLPEFTTYNQAAIPFAYPPLAFYAAGFTADLTGMSLTDAFRLLPLLLSCLTIPAFYLLARQLVPSRVALVASVFAFALVPRSFVWLLMGGGTTRSLGFLFAIVALSQVYLLFSTRRWAYLPGAILLSAFTVLSHLETGWFLAFSTVLLFFFFGRNRQGVGASMALAAGVLAVTAPWWSEVVADHGMGPFLASFDTGGSVFSDADTRRNVFLGLARVVSTSEPFFPIIGTLALLGGLAAVTSGRWFLPVWWVTIVLLDVRAFPTFTTVPVAMLAGIGLTEVVIPALRRPFEIQGAPAPARALLGSPAIALVLVAFTAYAAVAALERRPGMGGEGEFLSGLAEDERLALEWVATETPPDARFLVVPDSSWETASTAEWFPRLGGRVSVATVQGSEWLPGGEFQRRVEAYYAAMDCGYKTSDCLQTWALDTGSSFTNIYFRKWGDAQCCSTLLDSLRLDPRYQVIYDGPGATIFAPAGSVPAVSSEHETSSPLP